MLLVIGFRTHFFPNLIEANLTETTQSKNYRREPGMFIFIIYDVMICECMLKVSDTTTVFQHKLLVKVKAEPQIGTST